MLYDHTVHMSHFGRSGTVLDTPNTLVSILNLTNDLLHTPIYGAGEWMFEHREAVPTPLGGAGGTIAHSLIRPAHLAP